VIHLTCTPPPVFVPEEYTTPAFLSPLLGSKMSLCPIQFHALFLGAFASLVAPFGGFFASGIKRAYKLDDFASLIPGHGGVYDRVDCQLIMGLATAVYFKTFIANGQIVTVSRLQQLAQTLSAADQLKLYKALGASLRAQKLI